MEVADALYGVSMRGDGITTVISQRLNRERVAVDAVEPTVEPAEPDVSVPSGTDSAT